jgi:dTDP-4-amino-4,6-dideoxygalactose transaminase
LSNGGANRATPRTGFESFVRPIARCRGGFAGAVVANDSGLAEQVARLARHGGLTKHQHQIEGINSRLDGMQAAILSVKLPHLPEWTKARQDTAALYDAGLNQTEDVVVPEVAAYRRLGHRPEQFPNAHRDQSRLLSLPMFAEITPEQQRSVIDLFREF